MISMIFGIGSAGDYTTLQPGEPRAPDVEPPEGGIGGAIPGEDGSMTSKTTKSAKKKDNTLLIAGAAVAGLFLFSRR